MPFSEIRQSVIGELLERVRLLRYRYYLRSVTLTSVRGFRGATITFDFPVTALIGPNGGGKSTVLASVGCAYKEIKPGLFFPKSAIGDNLMSEWTIEYEALDRGVNERQTIRRTNVFRRLRWIRGDVLDRPVKYFGIERTVPAGERPGLKKLMRPTYRHNNPLEPLNAEAADQIRHILGKNVEAYRQTKIEGEENFHIGANRGNEYSEFHFGAGEASIIRIVTSIEEMPENALILIEEIENGLHPVAVKRLVEYLIDAASRKKIQVLFTTHSDHALDPLPREGVWACLDGFAQQGKLSVEALRAVIGRVDVKLAIFVEDEFAKFVVEAMIREFIPEHHDQIIVHYISGDSNTVRIHRARQEDPTTLFNSLCILDGDSQELEDVDNGIVKLPGAQPEATIFGEVKANLAQNIALLTVSLQLPPEKQQFVANVINEIAETNRDPHLIFNQIGIKLNFTAEAVVRGAFVTIWLRENSEIIRPLIGLITETMEA